MCDPLDDPDVTAAFKIMGANAPKGDLCPGCATRHLVAGEDLCPRCTERAAATSAARSRKSKARWWAEQSSYDALRAKHGAQDAAVRWVAHRLRREPNGVPLTDIRREAYAAGISGRSLRHARTELRRQQRLTIVRRGSGRDGTHTSVWRLTQAAPDAERPE